MTRNAKEEDILPLKTPHVCFFRRFRLSLYAATPSPHTVSMSIPTATYVLESAVIAQVRKREGERSSAGRSRPRYCFTAARQGLDADQARQLQQLVDQACLECRRCVTQRFLSSRARRRGVGANERAGLRLFLLPAAKDVSDEADVFTWTFKVRFYRFAASAAGS